MTEEFFQSEIHRLLKLGPDLSKPYNPPVEKPEPTEADFMFSQNSESGSSISGAPMNLPVMENSQSPDDIVPKFSSNGQSASGALEFKTAPDEIKEHIQERAADISAKASTAVKSAKQWSGLLVYPLVFVVAFGFFYVVLNFNALMLQIGSWFAKDESEVILQEDLEAYQQWINGYFFAVGDKEKLEPNHDIDTDGLTNLDEFIIKTNPTLSDSDSDGISDGIEVINGTNPWGTGKMSAKQQKTLEKVDLIKINNRISFNAASKNLADLSHTQNFDMTKPGRLSIPKLNLQVPIIWTEDPVQFDQDLTRGVVHYPGTALPGERGTVYISGHSSDYFWKSHPYKQVFARINALEPGDDIFVDVYGIDGKIYNYKYRVTSETIYAPDDQAQFIDNTQAKLNLSTCWPIGTQKDRYVVSAVLEKL